MSLGAELDLVVYLTSRYFPPCGNGNAFGVLYPGFLTGVAVSPVIYALLHQLTGDYSLGFLWAAVLLAISVLLFATLPRFAYAAPNAQEPFQHADPHHHQ